MDKLKIKISKFNELLTLAYKGAGRKPLVERTNLISIWVSDGYLWMMTTDGSNYVYLKEPTDLKEFNVVTEVQGLYDNCKAMENISSIDSIELSTSDKALIIKADKTTDIKLPLYLDDDGNMLKLPSPYEGVEGWKEEIKLSNNKIGRIISAIKDSLAVTYENPQFTNYYVKDVVIGTDAYVLSQLKSEIFKKARLLSPKFMDLLNMVKADMTLYSKESNLIAESDNIIVYGSEANGLDDYDLTLFKPLFDKEFKNSVQVESKNFMACINLVSLAITQHDLKSICLQFKDNSLDMFDSKKNSVINIPYVEGSGSDFSCYVDSERLLKVLRTIEEDNFIIEYDENNTFLKIVDNDLTHLISLMDDVG